MELRVKEILKEKGMTLYELAEKMQVSRQALSRQIGGKVMVETAERISAALDVPLWHLFVSPAEVYTENNTHVCPHCGNPIHIELS